MTCTKHCGICGQAFKGSFPDVMKRLRSHRKNEHPKAHKQSVRKTLRTKAKLDPETKVRKKLITVPRVINFKDFQGKESKIRVLHRANSTLFPELMIYVKFKGMAHEIQDDMLKDAGFTEESRGKWVLRTNKFSIFVYV